MTEEKTIQDLEKEFYSKPLSLSYSGLSKMMYSPQLYYNHYVLQKREEKIESYLVDGKVIHCLLLDNGSFDEQFIMLPSKLPADNTRLVLHMLFARSQEGTLNENTQHVIDILKEINLHQTLKTDEQRVAKIISPDTAVYYEFLKSKGNKTLLDNDTLQRCQEAVDILRTNLQVSDLLGLHANDFNEIDVQNEKEFRCETPLCGLHGIVDNLKIDHSHRNITINDLKTSGKTLNDFPETVEFYNYWAQASIYWELIHSNFKTLIDEGYTVSFNFIVIDKYNQVYAFPVSIGTMINWCARLEEQLKHADWHFKNNSFSLPYKFAIGQVIL